MVTNELVDALVQGSALSYTTYHLANKLMVYSRVKPLS